ncbi:hypothetical protein ALI22I_33425 [Saccharothrix sp. ALI-22-I]|uniref:ATP-binding protein n=1 Tax=Saccharothrix sp. ALI-22-I TaxID=1933778 RepID=UPI00097C443D|nr:ATP-binding protein [Saccharothrix sp. ALI-22-I]ONI83417.1 hypothetical protein ALI22I_33425 [Saccharothrix sp. ALI-22-I]
MTISMKTFRCWTAESVRQTVFSDIGAMPTDTDAVFMAAHTPMVLEHLRGSEIRDGDTGERRVLNALLATMGDNSRNTLIAITGASGAGKSHVVRWVHANLDREDDRYHVLYVPRAVQTIRQLLKRIVEGLPGGGGTELMERVDAAVGKTTPGELRDRLLAEIRLVLTWTLEPAPARPGEDKHEAQAREMRTSLLGLADEQGKRRNGLADLLELPPVNQALLRPGGLLDRFTGSVYEETSSRDDQQEGFTRDDLPLREARMRRALADNRELRDLWNVIELAPDSAMQLLNEALAQAAPRALGFRGHNGETLASLFHRSRQILRSENKELVLLFEDLVQFGLIDGELYDQFTIQPGDDMAPLRVVFAVTNGAFDRLHETVTTRITHRFAVTPNATTDREQFIGRYLNLVRVGRPDVEKAWAEADRDGSWMRNACDTLEDGNPCRFRDKCHAGFGAVDIAGLGRVGLYPYNDVALTRALKGQGESPTPREVLDVCVTQELIEADARIEDGTYPHEGVRERFDFTVQRAKEMVLRGRSGEQAERLYRALVLWGDERELPPAVAEAFSIQPTSGSVISAPALAQPGRQGGTPKAEAPTASPAVNPLLPLYQWQNGEELPGRDADQYRSILYKLVSERLDLDQDLFHTAGNGTGGTLLKKLFRSYSFVIEDSRGRIPSGTNVRFDLTRDPEDVRAMIAAKWFDDHSRWNAQDADWVPEDYDLVDLMLTLEDRLDRWAAEVRRRFLEQVGEREVVRAAIGLRAVALLALGTIPDRLKSTNSVLTGKPKVGDALPGWAEVDRTARDVLNAVSAADLIANFAAVRQGDTGGPKLIDAIGLKFDLRTVVKRPVEYLRGLESSAAEGNADVANWAKKLANAVEKAASARSPELTEAVDYISTELHGYAPKDVADSAREVARAARDHGLFRPGDGFESFMEAATVVEQIPSSLPRRWPEDDDRSPADQVLAAQGWASAAINGAKALTQLKNNMEATRAECARNDATAEDLEARIRAVRTALGDIRGHLDELRTPEGGLD